jgi:hypothetical protein
MPVKIIHPDHIEIVGLGRVLLTTPHASGVGTDVHAGSIIEEAALTSRSYAVIGKANREFLDLSRIQSAKSQLRMSIESFIAEDGIRYILDIHGKKESGVEVGTAAGTTCSDSTTELVRSRLGKDFMVRVDDGLMETGGAVTSYNRKDAKGAFVVETVQIDFGHEEMQFQREKVIAHIAEIADILNARLVA